MPTAQNLSGIFLVINCHLTSYSRIAPTIFSVYFSHLTDTRKLLVLPEAPLNCSRHMKAMYTMNLAVQSTGQGPGNTLPPPSKPPVGVIVFVMKFDVNLSRISVSLYVSVAESVKLKGLSARRDDLIER